MIAARLLIAALLLLATGALGRTRQLESNNKRDRFWRHKNGLLFLQRYNFYERPDFTFRIVQGLAAPFNLRAVSFESVNNPGHYLRHQSFRIKLHRRDGSDLFDRDATFAVEKANADPCDPDLVSFRSVNKPFRYIRHRSSELWLDPVDSTQAAEDSTFRAVILK